MTRLDEETSTTMDTRLFERLIDPPWYTSGTALRAVLVCEAIFGPRES